MKPACFQDPQRRGLCSAGVLLIKRRMWTESVASRPQPFTVVLNGGFVGAGQLPDQTNISRVRRWLVMHSGSYSYTLFMFVKESSLEHDKTTLKCLEVQWLPSCLTWSTWPVMNFESWTRLSFWRRSLLLFCCWCWWDAAHNNTRAAAQMIPSLMLPTRPWGERRDIWTSAIQHI